eukprot:Skav204873  [mRNA]  locus=scaffold1679:172614:175074:- [translate_table: standard]
MSYFVGAKAVKQADGIAEDGGFAINGGKGTASKLRPLAADCWAPKEPTPSPNERAADIDERLRAVQQMNPELRRA